MVVCRSSFGISCGTTSTSCPDKNGCYAGICPDFIIRRHDTKPPFKAAVADCDGPLDLTDLILEASMWAKAKLKTAISKTDQYFGLADNIGFDQLMVGDVIIMDRPRLPEHMLVVAFDETNQLVQVQRGYHGTTIQSWKKGSPLRIMKFIDASSSTEMVMQEIIQVDGTTEEELTDSLLVYEWSPADTCLPGCYYLEFKLLKMSEDSASMSMLSTGSTVVPSFTDPNLTPTDFGCTLGEGVEWVRRFPVEGEGFIIQIVDSPTAEI